MYEYLAIGDGEVEGLRLPSLTPVNVLDQWLRRSALQYGRNINTTTTTIVTELVKAVEFTKCSRAYPSSSRLRNFVNSYFQLR